MRRMNRPASVLRGARPHGNTTGQLNLADKSLPGGDKPHGGKQISPLTLKTQEEAIRLAKQEAPEANFQLLQRLDLYRAKKPYRMPKKTDGK